MVSTKGAPFSLAVANNWDQPSQSFIGRLEVFIIGTHGTIEHIWQTSVNNGWSGWIPLGSQQASEIAVGQNADGRLEVFAADSNHAMWHIWQTAGNNGWSNWSSLGFGIRGMPAQEEIPVLAQHFRLPPRSGGAGIGQNQDGSLEVFASYPPLQSTGTLIHAFQVPFGGTGGWLGRVDIMDNVGQVAAVGQNSTGNFANPDGRLEVFTVDGSNIVWHLFQNTPGATSSFSSLMFLGGPTGSPPMDQIALGQNADGRLEAFGVDSHGTVFHIWQLTAGDPTSWGSTWDPIGSGQHITQIAVGQNADGRLELFGLDGSGGSFHLWQQWPGGGWTGWNVLAGVGPITPNALVVGQNHDGRLEVFGIDSHKSVVHCWQDPTMIGGWSGWVYL